ncbi:MAG: copper amine oxidase N-terminal domain-containing protein [Marinisporobacter sp.]|nr:copper amine oxidase N-terminal domain-containing protein [Marinisporobacter sp.]
MKRTIKRILLVPAIFTLLFSMILMPMHQNTVYAASDNSMNKVPRVRVGHEFNNPTTAPLLRIEELDVNEFGRGREQIFHLDLKNAEWLTDNDFKDSKYKSFRSAIESQASHCFRPLSLSIERLSNTTVQATVYDSVYNDYEASTVIPMLVKTIDQGAVQVEIDAEDSHLTSGRYTIANVKHSFETRPITITANIGALPTQSLSKIKFILPEGFEWLSEGIASGYDEVFRQLSVLPNIINNRTLELEIYYNSNSAITLPIHLSLEDIYIKSTSKTTDDYVEIKASCEGISRGNITVRAYNTILKPPTIFIPSNNWINTIPKIVRPGYKFKDINKANFLKIRPTDRDDKLKLNTFRLHLENAEWLTDNDFENNTFKSAMESELQHFHINRISNTTVQATVYDKENVDRIDIPIFAKVLGEGPVKISLDERDSSLTPGNYMFAVGTNTHTRTTIKNIKTFKNDEILTLDNIEIDEAFPGYSTLCPFLSREISLKLPKGFEWVETGIIKGIGCFKEANKLAGSPTKILVNKDGMIKEVQELKEITSIASIDGSTLKMKMDYSPADITRSIPGKIILEGAAIKAISKASIGNIKIIISGKDWNDGIDNEESVIAVYNKFSSSVSGGGGGGGSSAPTKTEDKDDDSIEKALKNSKEVKLSIQDKKEAKTHISLSVLNKVRKADKPLKIENKDISLIFSKQALHVKNLEESGTDATLEISAKAVRTATKDKILSEALKNKGLFQVDSEVFELSCDVVGKKGTTKISNFEEPVAITIDVSDKKLSKEEIRNLTGIRYEKDEKGNIVPVKLGGTYDPNTKTFTFYTDQFSLYGVLKAQGLRKINLRIDDTYANVNNTPNTLELAPTIINNRTMVPLRFVAEGLGADVEWIDETKTVKLELDDKKLSFIIGEKQSGMDVPAMIKNGRTLVPIRYVSENLGANVLWFPSSKKIEIIK